MLFQIIGVVLLIPFFGWAIVLLRRRFVFYEENSIAVEAGTALALALFFWLEATVLRYALGPQLLLYFFAILGLSVAAFALYAHVIISLASRIMVDLVLPGDQSAPDQPRFGPVEALERSEDFEGALQEYLVLARIYPRNFEVLKRTGRIQEVLGNPEEAVTWYQRARKRARTADEALTAVNRLCALYDTELEQPDACDLELTRFLEDFPDALDHGVVADRLARRKDRVPGGRPDALDALEESPLEHTTEVPASPESLPAVGPPLRPRVKTELVKLQAEGALESPAPPQGTRTSGRTPSQIGLESLGKRPAADKQAEDDAGAANGRGPESAEERPPARDKTPPARSSALESLDTVESSKPETKKIPASSGSKSDLTLERLQDSEPPRDP